MKIFCMPKGYFEIKLDKLAQINHSCKEENV